MFWKLFFIYNVLYTYYLNLFESIYLWENFRDFKGPLKKTRWLSSDNWGCTHGIRGGLLARDVEEDEIFTGHNVGHPIPVIRHWAETPARWDTLGVFLQIKAGSLTVGGLGGRQAPRLAEHFLQRESIKASFIFANSNVPIREKLARLVLYWYIKHFSIFIGTKVMAVVWEL